MYLLNVLIALDQLVNTLIGGQPDETLSAAAFNGELNGKPVATFFRKLIDFLFYPFQKRHCYQAWMAEKNREQLRGY